MSQYRNKRVIQRLYELQAEVSQASIQASQGGHDDAAADLRVAARLLEKAAAALASGVLLPKVKGAMNNGPTP